MSDPAEGKITRKLLAVARRIVGAREPSAEVISSPQLIGDLIRIMRTGRVEEMHSEASGDKPLLVSVPSATPAGTAVDAYRIEVDGMVFFLPVPHIAQSDDSFFERILQRRWYPLDMIHALLPFTHGGIMLDVGANIGTTSIPRGHLRLFDRIHAFEPEDCNFTCLSHAVAENGLSEHIKAWRNAVGAEARTGSLLISTGIARYHMSSRIAKRTARGDTFQEIEVISLDGWGENETADAEQVRFVKVDTQGFELDVLSGASALSEREGVVWQLEMSPRLTRAAGQSFGDLLALIEQRFDWYIDLRKPGSPLSTRGISSALQYLTAEGKMRYTDIIAFKGPSQAP